MAYEEAICSGPRVSGQDRKEQDRGRGMGWEKRERKVEKQSKRERCRISVKGGRKRGEERREKGRKESNKEKRSGSVYYDLG